MTDGNGAPRRGPTVGDAMRHDVVVVDVAASLTQAARRMREHEVGCLPVLERDRLVGMVTDRDVVVRGLGGDADFTKLKVGDVMTVGPLTTCPERSVEEAYTAMTRAGVRRLVVVDDGGGVRGLISWHDLGTFAGRQAQARQVGFYRRMVDSHGHPHRIELYRLYVSPGVPANEVEPFAIGRFEALHGDIPWRLVADDYEVAGA